MMASGSTEREMAKVKSSKLTGHNTMESGSKTKGVASASRPIAMAGATLGAGRMIDRMALERTSTKAMSTRDTGRLA